jgi:hypothetical protein
VWKIDITASPTARVRIRSTTALPERSNDVLEQVLVREVAGVFLDAEALEAAVDALLLAGFDRSDIDLMADADAIRTQLGSVYVPAQELADVPGAPRKAFLNRDDTTIAMAETIGILFSFGAMAAAAAVVASGGALALAIAGAAAGGIVGGSIGALAARVIGKERAKRLEAMLIEGGLVLWVRVRTPALEDKAQSILEEHGAKYVRVHEISIEKRLADLPLADVRPDPWLGGERLAEV